MTDPFALFDAWLAEARASEVNDPEAMALATADAVGNPSARMVLLKGRGPNGFTFYTNEQSVKGEELAANPNAALATSSSGPRSGLAFSIPGNGGEDDGALSSYPELMMVGSLG